MSEFFKQPNGPIELDEARAYDEHYTRQAQEAVLKKASELKEPLAYLRAELQRRHIPTDTLVADEIKTVNKFRKERDKVTGEKKSVADQTFIPTSQTERGWTISKAKTRFKNQAIVLMEDGSLKLGDVIVAKSPANPQSGKPAKGYLIGTRSRLPQETQLDLDAYPINSLFEKEELGYKATNGAMPDLEVVRNGTLSQSAPEARVHINLEQIERDLRQTGRELLGIK